MSIRVIRNQYRHIKSRLSKQFFSKSLIGESNSLESAHINGTVSAMKTLSLAVGLLLAFLTLQGCNIFFTSPESSASLVSQDPIAIALGNERLVHRALNFPPRTSSRGDRDIEYINKYQEIAAKQCLKADGRIDTTLCMGVHFHSLSRLRFGDNLVLFSQFTQEHTANNEVGLLVSTLKLNASGEPYGDLVSKVLEVLKPVSKSRRLEEIVDFKITLKDELLLLQRDCHVIFADTSLNKKEGWSSKSTRDTILNGLSSVQVDSPRSLRCEKIYTRKNESFVVLGHVSNVSNPKEFFFVAQYLPNGNPDPTFSKDGFFILPDLENEIDSHWDYSPFNDMLDDGSMLVVRRAAGPVSSEVVSVLLPNGEWDEAHGVRAADNHFEKYPAYSKPNARVLNALPGGGYAMQVNILRYEMQTRLEERNNYIARFRRDGELDKSWGNEGLSFVLGYSGTFSQPPPAPPDLSRFDVLFSFTPWADGRGLYQKWRYGYGSGGIVEANIDGSVDDSFGPSGRKEKDGFVFQGFSPLSSEILDTGAILSVRENCKTITSGYERGRAIDLIRHKN